MLQQIFKLTQDRYNISSKSLSEQTGIAASTISGIRCGKTDPSCSTLWRLLSAMEACSPGAKAYFCRELSGVDGLGSGAEALVDSLAPDEIADLLLAVSQVLRRRRLEREKSACSEIEELTAS